MQSRNSIAGLFVTGTDTEVGKTVVAGGIAACLRHRGCNVGVFKPVATGCTRRRGRLFSADAEFLAHCADTSQSLDQITPIMFTQPLAPTVAAKRARKKLDLDILRHAFQRAHDAHDFVVVEGIGGLAVPLVDQYTVADFAAECGLPTIVVARAGLGTINHTHLTVAYAIQHSIRVLGVVINQYDVESIGIAEETNPQQIAELTGMPTLAIVPRDAETSVENGKIGPDVIFPLSQVDWQQLVETDDRRKRSEVRERKGSGEEGTSNE